MESLTSQQQQKHQKMGLPMNDAEEFDLNPIDWDVPLPRSNSFVPTERRLKAECYPAVSRCSQDAEHPTCPPTLAVDRDLLKESDLPTSFRATA